MFSLLSQHRHLLSSVRDKIDQAGEKLFQDINGWAALRNIFASLAEEIRRRQHMIYLIVDALDECLEYQDDLLRWIADLSSLGIRVLVSSRNWYSIESELRSAAQALVLRLELNADSVSTAVELYIDYKAAELAKLKNLNAETRDTVQAYLRSNSGNTFLWVAMVCQRLGHKSISSRKVIKTLRTFPPGLNELYKRMADQFLSLEDVQDVELCRQVLAVQVRAYRPLSLTELSSLVDSLEGFSLEWLQEVIELCGSFLAVRDNTVFFVHQSAKDYLVEHVPDSIFRQRLLAGHHFMFSGSIQALSHTLIENIYKLPSIGSHIDSIEVPNPDPLDGIRYVCVYWADHLENGKLMAMENKDLEDGGLLHEFLKKHLLHWLEALSHLRRLGSGAEALAKVLSLLQKSQNADGDLHKLVYDAWRFLRLFYHGIEAAPLQVYGPGHIFCPTTSVVRKLFLEPKWLLMSMNEETDWSPCIQQLQGHTKSVMTVAFSPNSRCLASGADDSTVRVWDVLTGVCLNILVGHRSIVSSVAFSPDNECVASSSYDGTIRIWNATTGACLQILETGFHGDSIVVFADDTTVISVQPTGGAIQKWKTVTGERLKAHNIHNGRESMCVSHNGRRAAWVSRRKGVIELLDLVSGESDQIPWQTEIARGLHRP